MTTPIYICEHAKKKKRKTKKKRIEEEEKRICIDTNARLCCLLCSQYGDIAISDII
jgi:hypothetical protein